MTSEDYKWFALILFTALIDCILFFLAFKMTQSFNAIHIEAVAECIAINQAANGTVCLV